MKKLILSALALAVASNSAAQAQNTYYWKAPVTVADEQTQAFFLPSGTPLKLRILNQVSSRDSKPGDRVYLEVAESVSFRGQVVIPVGAPAFGEVSVMERKSFRQKGQNRGSPDPSRNAERANPARW